jgi:TonB family protein
VPNTMTFFLEVAWKSTVLLAAAWTAVLCLRNKSAAIRHQVWCLALVAILLLPVLSRSLPALAFPRFSSLLPATLLFQTDAISTDTSAPALKSSTKLSPRPRQWLANGAPLLTALWAVGTAVSLLQMLLGWIAVERLRRNAKPVSLPGVDDNIDLRLAEADSMPITYGLFRPVILLPSDSLAWAPERRRIVVLHELAHVRRKDGATHLLARFALALYWWHPLVWTAWRESLNEQERAADDFVLRAGEPAPDYASHLLAIARSMHSPTGALAMARASQLEGRLSAILDSQRTRHPLRAPTALAASLMALAILVPVAALQARSSPAQAVSTNNPEQARLLAQGKDALSTKNFDLAINFFERAQSADPQKTAESKMWLAITRQTQDDLEASAALYKSALEVEVPDSPSLAAIMDLYAAVLRQLNRTEEATKFSQQADTIRRIQGDQVLSQNPTSPDALRIGGDVKAPRLISKIEPKYSEDARLAKYTGAVLLSVEIGKDGGARNIRVTRPLGLGLDEKAVEAVKQWKFAPGTLNGVPVVVSAQVEVNFRLL